MTPSSADLRAPLETAARTPASHAAKTRGSASRRATFVRWLRKTHGWFGLWGAVFGLLFGVSGIWLNHRAVLKLPPVAQQRSETQIDLPQPPPATPPELAAWLAGALKLDGPPLSTRIEPARPVPWADQPAHGGGRPRGSDKPAPPDATAPAAADAASPAPRPLMQPARWTFNFGGPHSVVQAEYWAGNRSVSVRTTDNGVLGTLMNMHKGVGMSVPWILVIDAFAGSLILLSLSGVLLWLQTHRARTTGIVLVAASLAMVGGLLALRA